MSETIYTLAERQRVYPEWEPVWIVDPHANPPLATGDTVCSVRLVDAMTLELEMVVFDAVPAKTTEETRDFGTVKTVEYEIQPTGRRFVMVLRAWVFRPALATLSGLVSCYFQHPKLEINSRRPKNRAPDGWSLNCRNLTSKSVECAAELDHKGYPR